jgi:DNA polymerase III sliding clamp (beta) subunit (PCNA family)
MSQDNLEVTFHNPEVGEGREVVPVTLDQGDASELPMQIGYNARYFLEPLAAMTGDVVFLELNDQERPCRLVQQDDPNYFAIIMPMSL